MKPRLLIDVFLRLLFPKKDKRSANTPGMNSYNNVVADTLQNGMEGHPQQTVDWKLIQQQSDSILSEGLRILSEGKYSGFNGAFPTSSGNYLISNNQTPVYIGESTNISNLKVLH
ncbi:MAG TPA: hypothetical protein VN426_04310 [Syntrophomonadaceae bacterium]|nr:hypothetical protein [Syntrophomonadaceae bacterium]